VPTNRTRSSNFGQRFPGRRLPSIGETRRRSGVEPGRQAVEDPVEPVREVVVAVVLLTNGGGARELYAALHRELLAEPAGVTTPQPFAPPARPPAVGFAPLVGTYRREGVAITVTEQDGAGHAVYEFVDGTQDFSTLRDGTGCVHIGMRCGSKTV
jgi:hypothetical protein